MSRRFGFCQLAGGSKGNCSILQFEKKLILIDAGLSVKKLQAHLHDLGYAIEDIDGIFITHEHQDHINGLKTLSKTIDVPIFCNLETAKAIYRSLNVDSLPFHIFQTDTPFSWEELDILPLSIPHDAVEPVGYRIESGNTSIGIFTDIGSITDKITEHLQNVHYLILEANHEVSLVHQSKRSIVYKERVLSRFGHLSNEEAKKLIEAIDHANLKKIILTHLSDECNDLEIVKEHFKAWDVVIADQNEKTDFIEFFQMANTT